jgi:hypothetical protein
LPYLGDFDWKATILTVAPEFAHGPIETLLNGTIPGDCSITRTAAAPEHWTRWFGLGSLALRSLPYLWRAGNRLLQSGEFDLIYFSTTEFPVTILGPIWRKRFKVPYVVDFQDPWRRESEVKARKRPPGGHLRYGISRLLARLLEPRVMNRVGQVIVVSPAYRDTLMNRYSWLSRQQYNILPFGAPERDFEMLSSLGVKQRIFDPKDGLLHVVYVGRGGEDMASSLRIIFKAIRSGRTTDSQGWSRVRLHFVGTSYAPAGRGEKTIEPLAAECGVEDIVVEQPDRIGYFETLQALRESAGLLIVGSDSASYTPSKIFPYVLAKRPTLGVLHQESPAVAILQRCRAAEIIRMKENGKPFESDAAVDETITRFLHAMRENSIPKTDWAEFEPFTAREMTRRQCEVFNRACIGSNGAS